MPDTNQQEIWAERVGVALRARRLDLGLTLQDLSRLSGSTVASLSLIERGKRDVKLSTLVALAAALRTDLSAVLRADGSGA